MLSVDRILFPTDGSDCAKAAHDRAVTLAQRHRAELHVLNVVEKRTNNLDNLAELIDIRQEDILEDLRIPVEHTENGDIREEKVTHPSAAGGILQYARTHDIDLIVMGTHGRRGVQRVLMGSVAEEVVRLAECPVFTVCADGRPVEIEGGRILVPLDFSAHGDELLAHAEALAHEFKASVDLLHVIETISLPAVYGIEGDVFDVDDVRGRAADALAERAAHLQEQGIEVQTHLRVGHPGRSILDFIEEEGSSMVVIATHGRTGVKHLLLGSVAEKVVRMAPCPVFTVKSFGKSIVAEASAA
jgi:nucleotide-binding universal stress UspA family protein